MAASSSPSADIVMGDMTTQRTEIHEKDVRIFQNCVALLSKMHNRTLAAVTAVSATMLHQRNVQHSMIEFGNGQDLKTVTLKSATEAPSSSKGDAKVPPPPPAPPKPYHKEQTGRFQSKVKRHISKVKGVQSKF